MTRADLSYLSAQARSLRASHKASIRAQRRYVLATALDLARGKRTKAAQVIRRAYRSL